MNVRITDLLDRYYDDTVKLAPPEALTPTAAPELPPSKPGMSRLQKPLLVAATLMLVVSGTIALGLGFQRGTVPGSMAGEAVSAFEITPPPEAPALESSEEALESTGETPGEAAAVWTTGVVRFAYFQQTGSTASFRLYLSSVPADMVAEAGAFFMEAIAVTDAGSIADTPALNYISMDGYDYDQNTKELLVHGTATLPAEADYLSFYVKLHGCNGGLLISENAATMRLTSLTGYAAGGDGLYDLTELNDTTQIGTVKWYEVTEEHLRVLIELPTPEAYFLEENAGEAADILLRDAIKPCINALNFSTIMFLMESGAQIDLYADLDVDVPSIDIIGTDIENEDGSLSTQVMATIAIRDSSLSPLEIDLVEFAPYSGTEELSMPTLSGSDTNGDGLLSTALSVPLTLDDGSTGTLTNFSLDLATGEITWTHDTPDLKAHLYAISPQGDLPSFNEEPDYRAEHVRWINAYLNIWNDAKLVFTDGTSVSIGGGDVPTFDADTGRFYERSYLPVEYMDADILEIDYLTINGESYTLE